MNCILFAYVEKPRYNSPKQHGGTLYESLSLHCTGKICSH